jgi:hypothetical protein
MIHDLTVRTRLGSVDLVPFLQRDEGLQAETLEWERKPAALALSDRGWSADRIARATGLKTSAVTELLGTGTVSVPVPVNPARADRSKQARACRFAERIKVDGRWFHPRAPHGTTNGYGNYGCRCTPCTDVHSAACGRYAAKLTTAAGARDADPS